MNTLWRGLKGAMVGLGIACILVLAEPTRVTGHIPLPTFLALLVLASLLVVGIGRVSAGLPRKSLRMLKRSAVVAAMTSPIVVVGLRNRGIELPGLSYLLPILEGLLGGAIVLLYESGAAAQAKTDVESENRRRATNRDSRSSKIDRFWLWVSLATWLAATIAFLLSSWLQIGGGVEVPFVLAFPCTLWGGILMLYFVGIPLRVALNLILKERRRKRLWETVMCIVVFVIMSYIAYLVTWVYPPSSMGY